jgi:rod shape-determining protein MreC
MAAGSSLGTGGLGRTGDKGSSGRLTAVLLAISIVLFTISCQEAGSGVLSSIRGVFTIVTTPVEYLGMVVTTPFRGLGNIFTNLTADQQTLLELEEENKELKAENAQLAEDANDVDELRGLLELQDTYSLESTGAHIIAGSTDSWSSTVTIDKGTSSGLEVGMPVCDSHGVLGQIIECGTSSSVVRLISDENSSVSAMVQDSRALGTLEGSADGTIYLTGVSLDQEVKVGDTIVTSGLGGVFPKGLPIGTVTSVDTASGAVNYTITVDPLASSSSQEVLVITSITEEQQASADEYDQATTEEATTDDSTTDAQASTETTG